MSSKKERNGHDQIMVSVPMTVAEREILREASAATDIPQAVFLRDAGLEMAGRKLWEIRRTEAAFGRKPLFLTGKRKEGARKSSRRKAATAKK